MKRSADWGTAAVCCAVMLLSCSASEIKKGTVALELGDYTMAVAFFGRVLERDPGSFDARLGMGKALLQRAIDRTGDTVSWHEALMHLEAARTLRSGSDVHKLISQVWAERAYGLLYAKDTLGALGAVTRAIAADPESPEPLNLAGIIYFRTGKPQKAQLLFEKVLTVDSSSASALFNLGMVHWEQRQVGKAHEYWLRTLKLDPGDEEFLYWFAVAEKNLRADDAGDGGGGK
jgi:tetratricopeptide (TPR) repeat protein